MLQLQTLAAAGVILGITGIHVCRYTHTHTHTHTRFAARLLGVTKMSEFCSSEGCIWIEVIPMLGFLGGLVLKNPPASTGDVRDAGSIPGSARSPGGGHDNPLQYSCLEPTTDRGAWQATVHGVTKSRT